MTTQLLDAIIFDMDGLMVDSEPLWWRVEHELAQTHGIPWTDAQARACVGRGLEHVIETMRVDHGLAITIEDGVASLQRAFFEEADQLPLMAGCAELVHHARRAGNLRLAVASSSPRALIERVLAPTGLIPSFDVICSGTEVRHPKPAPDVFLHAAEKLQVSPDRCLVLEDSVAGAEAGSRAGMRVFAVADRPAEAFAPWATQVFGDLHGVASMLGFHS